MGNTGYAFLLCPDCSAQIRKQPEYKFRLIAGSTNEALQTIPNSGMIPTIDVGDEFCIHPPQKNVVGLRLANLALTKTYGLHKFPSTGPMMTKVEYSKNKAIVTLDNAPSGLAPGN